MGKGKPRHNPNKYQNKYGGRCPLFESFTPDSKNGAISIVHCECGSIEDAKVCKGNKHNCVKTYLHREASKSDAQKINDFRRNQK